MELKSPVNKETLLEIRDFIMASSTWAPSFEQVTLIAWKIQSGLIKVEDDGFDHQFQLQEEGKPIMFTEVDRAEPRIDPEFWDQFLKGKVTMVYLGPVPRDPENSLE